ncbi:protein of unknown function (plasmid) [Pararobbsia alpina]
MSEEGVNALFAPDWDLAGSWEIDVMPDSQAGAGAG